MKVGILGSGDVGKALAVGFLQHKHEVTIGTREPSKLADWAAVSGAQLATVSEAAAFGEVIVLATAWHGTEAALQSAGPKNFAGKVVIDVTNPLSVVDGRPSLAVGHTSSGGEQVQRWLPDAKVVKCFNIVNSADMVNPSFPGGPPDMFIAGDDAEARNHVAVICKDFGWEVIDLGDITNARYLESLAMLWVRIGMTSGNWKNAWKLLRK